MRKILVRSAAIAAAIVLIVLAIGVFLPTLWSVEASIVIAAKPADIHPWVADFSKWNDWAIIEADPAVRYEFGPGVLRWKGERTRGEIEITRSDPASGIEYKGRIESDEVNSRGSIRYETVEGGTRVVWRDEGELGMKPVGGWMVGMLESALEEHFQGGLDRLKAAVE